MRRWLIVVGGSIGLVAIWALPPSAFEPPARNATPEALHLESVEREVARTHAALRALRWSDSLTELAVRTAEDGLILSPPSGDGVDPEAAASWEESQRRLLRSRAVRDPEMIVGVFWQPINLGALPGVRALARGEEMTFVGSREGRSYCLRAIPFIRPDARVLRRTEAHLGACRLYAAYGTPGAEIQGWLEASGLGFAQVPDEDWAAYVARFEPTRAEGTMRLFGMWKPPLASHGVVTQACLARRPAACARAVSDPAVIGPAHEDRAWLLTASPATSVGGRFSDPPFGYLDDALLYEWEAEFGPDAFARFWTSSEPMPEAFEASFGVPLGAWVLGWVERRAELYRAGPSLPWGSVGWSLVALAALAGAATVAGVRRRVG